MTLDSSFVYDEITTKINIMHNLLVDIRSGDVNKEQIDELFRSIHTIKGIADLLYLTNIVEVAHKSEDLLQEVRDGNLHFDSSMISLFVEIKEYLELVVNNINQGIFDDEMVDKLYSYFMVKIDSFKSQAVLIITSDDIVENLSDDEKKGYSLFHVQNNSDALNILEVNPIKLLFIDIEFFTQKCIEFVKEVREMDEYHYLPVVVIVPNGYRFLSLVGKQTGAKAWIDKPLDEDKILKVIKRILG